MTRTELINLLIKSHGLKSYLEIGTQKKANNFDKIIAERKYSIDPDPKSNADLCCTSDEYFSLHITEAFDLIFIDGLHHAEQVEADIINSMTWLNPRGFLVLHDCNPKEEWQQLVPRQHKVWYGNVWRAFVGFRIHYPNIKSYCLDHDCGLGIIHYSKTKLEAGFSATMSWAEFSENRNRLLGII